MSMRDPIAAVVTLALSLTMFVLSLNYSGGSEIFPRWISAILIVCSVILLLRGIFWPTEDERMTPYEVRRVGISIVLTLAYVALIVPVGFITASVIYIPLASYALGLRQHIFIWATTIIYLVSVYYIFTKIFYTPLPQELILQIL